MKKANHRKSTANTENYTENPKGKNHEERERFHYNADDYNDFL